MSRQRNRSNVSVCLPVSGKISFDPDVWHADSSWRYLGQFEGQDHRSQSQEENVAIVVGATSSEGFPVIVMSSVHLCEC